MLKDSLKWTLITLLVALIVVAGFIVVPQVSEILTARREMAAVTPVPTPSPTPTLVPTSTPAPTPSPTPVPTATPVTLESWLTDYIAGMSTEDKLGQMALFGFSGTKAPGNGYTDNQQTYHVGNIILYGANVNSGNSDGGFSQCAQLIEAAKAGVTTEIPPFVAIDIEGGRVVRFHWPSWPLSARSLGKREAGFAYEQFYTVGAKLLETGINLDLAPVLDVSEDPMNTFLQTRIISEDANVTATIGSAIISGLHDAGCLSAAKHFPGHGGTTADSHDTTPVIHKSVEELLGYDLVPYFSAIDAGVDAILVTHILFPALDETDIASMSSSIITDLLREQMGYDGIVLSDDFRMGGLTSRYSAGDAAVQFILSGGDLIMCGAQYDRQAAIMQALFDAAADGTLRTERINESVYRILLAKIRRGVWDVSAYVAQ